MVRKYLLTATITSSLLQFGCSAVHFNSSAGTIAASSTGVGAAGNPAGTSTTTGTGGSTSNVGGQDGSGTAGAITHFQPAVAVRDSSCLACHANIQANMITDFGYSNSWYMAGFAAPTDFGNYHYMATTWQTMDAISGQVIVPTATLPSTFVMAELQANATLPNGTNPVDLVSYLNLTSMQNFGSSWYSYFKETTPVTMALANRVTGQPPVVAAPKVYIGAPTQAEILAMVPANTSAAPWVQAVNSSTSGLSGLSIATGVNGESYVVSTGPVQCSNQDVVINGTLLLNNLQIYAEKGGCRLYVTGSVFVEGPITYLNSGTAADPTDNLQITSATSVIMGVGLDGVAKDGGGGDDTTDSPLKVRLLDDVRSNLLLRVATTDAAYTTFATSILNEGLNIGASLLHDASVPGSLPTASSSSGQPRALIDFQHLLINAPLIHSRYMGTFTGVIVAESAMFSLGQFSFAYDPVFQNVPVLPALPYDILCTSTTCNPANP